MNFNNPAIIDINILSIGKHEMIAYSIPGCAFSAIVDKDIE